MKKLALLVIATVWCVCALAQTPKLHTGDYYYNGYSIFSLEVRHGGILYLADAECNEITMEPVANEPGVYRLIPSRQAEDWPYADQGGCRVENKVVDGQDVFMFYVDGNLVDMLVRVNEGESVEPAQALIDRFDITAFASDGPGDDDFDGDTDFVPEEDGRTVWYVANEIDFIAGLRSNTILNINAGVTINLSDVLYKQGLFDDVYGRAWLSESEAYDLRASRPELAASVSCYDGRELVLMGLHDVTIRGEGNVTIITEPRYANVLSFENCRNVSIENLTIGHTEEGTCTGGVIYCYDCEGISITDCDLYGCGTYGLEAMGCYGIDVLRTVVRDCSYGITSLSSTGGCTFTACDFMRCREFSMVSVEANCGTIAFNDCRFTQNEGLLFSAGATTQLTGCEIHHTMETGVDNDNLIYDASTRWYDDNAELAPRGIGPRFR